MKKEYLERIYAGWLAKIIGIRYGAPVEGWTYEKIKNIYGERTDESGRPIRRQTFSIRAGFFRNCYRTSAQ